MIKPVLPLSESFVLHATALVNQLHGRKTVGRDPQPLAIEQARNRRFSMTAMDPLARMNTNPVVQSLRRK